MWVKHMLYGGLTASLLSSGQASPIEDPGELQQHFGAPDSSSGVIQRLEKSRLIPDVLDPFDVEFMLNATWTPEGHAPVSASLGNTIKPSLLQDMPASLGLKDLPDLMAGLEPQPANLIVALTDPDAPTPQRPKNAQFCHWLQYTHRKHKSGKVKTKQLVPYMPPSPPRGSGKHRYALVIMVPKNGTKKKLHMGTPASRKRWGYKHKRSGLREWMEENDLVPIAANYFYSQHEKTHDHSSNDGWDESVGSDFDGN